MIARRSLLALPLLVTACSNDSETPQNFAFPSYSYLTAIRLNVANIEINDQTRPSPNNALESLAPVRPVDALKQMANDRLSAAGTAGRAVFVIDQASITRSDGAIIGVMAVHLDVFAGAGGERAGYAEARVGRRRSSNDYSEDPRGVLYAFTMKMMDDMNVEFEFQVKRSLRDWLQLTAGTAPPPPPVQTQDLASPSPAAPPSRAPTLTPPGYLHH